MSTTTVRELLALSKRVAKVTKTPKSHQSHVELNMTLEAPWDGQLRVFFRANVHLLESFSFGLKAKAQEARGWVVLLRVNGDHGGHRNPDGQLISGVPHAHVVSDLDGPVVAAEDSGMALALDPVCNRYLAAWAEFSARAGIEPSQDVESRLGELHGRIGQLDLDV